MNTKLFTREGFLYNKDTLDFLRPGDIIITRPYKNILLKHFISWFIMKTTRSYWTHTGIYNGNYEMIESIINGVKSRNILEVDMYVKDYMFIALRFKNDAYRLPFLNHVRNKIDCGYDYGQAITDGIIDILSDLLILSYKHIRNIFDSKNKYLCSEVVSDSLYDCGINVYDYININRSMLLPQDILLLDDIFELVNIDINSKSKIGGL